jgi:hypothetical protein
MLGIGRRSETGWRATAQLFFDFDNSTPKESSRPINSLND